MPMLFQPGRMLVTPGAAMAFQVALEPPAPYVRRHLTGDWGLLDAHDRKLNDRAVEQGGQILSAYLLQTGVKIYIITEPDRSATTILLPDEY